MAIENWELMQECFPKHYSSWEQQEWNKTKKQENGKQERVKYMGNKYCGHKIKDVLTAYPWIGVTDPRGRYSLKQWMDYLTNKYSNNNHNVSTTGEIIKSTMNFN